MYIVHLFDLVVRSETLKNVGRAVYNPIGQLSMTALLGLFLLYMFAIIAFFFLQDSFMNQDLGMVVRNIYNTNAM
jgi:hypothetical protein